MNTASTRSLPLLPCTDPRASTYRHVHCQYSWELRTAPWRGRYFIDSHIFHRWFHVIDECMDDLRDDFLDDFMKLILWMSAEMNVLMIFEECRWFPMLSDRWFHRWVRKWFPRDSHSVIQAQRKTPGWKLHRARQNALLRRQVAESNMASHGGSKRRIWAKMLFRSYEKAKGANNILKQKIVMRIKAFHLHMCWTPQL